ncbi:MAG: hypothetical protein ABI670_08065 [Chloroflexota bacterium]
MQRSNFLAGLMILFAFIIALPVMGQPEAPGSAATDDSGYAGLAAPLSGSPSVEQQTADLLAGTDAPGRDLISLTQRLRLKSNAPIPETVNAQQPDYKVGARQQFYIADVTQRRYFTATTTLKVVTEHAYWYVKDGYNANTNALQKAADYFEEKIYPTNRRVFGHEINPGVDNDPRITVLVAPVPGVGGYFSNADAYPTIVNPYSNQRDMIYLATLPRDNPADPDNYFEATLAHEFQHMIHWNVHRNREVWLDEGSSEVAMYLNGYDPGGADYSFTLNPDTQLNAWDDPSRTTPHYGASYLFLRYLMDKYGGESFISNLMQTYGLGTQGIDTVLKAEGDTAGFDGAFKDWTVANVLNDKQLQGGRYSYSEGGRVQASRSIKSYPATRSDTVHQYAADYISLGGKLASGTITFKGNATAKVIAAEPHSGASFWYSNRRDSGDATLTKQLDLSGASRATLNFWAWYDIEPAFDYAYVEASTDNGATWNTLKGKYTSTDNPNGTGYGNGWTGISGSANGKGVPKWVEESVDLSAYAGKKILVRFEYITDEGYNRPGLAIDDIRVPEIGFSDNAETSSDWTAEGFIRIGSRIPQKWFVALIEKGSPNKMREMTIASNGQGTINLSSLGTTTREAILVIAPLAPKTTELATYTVTIKKR